MDLKYIRLCFALIFLVGVQSCEEPCDRYPNNTCSLIQSVDNRTVGLLLTSHMNQTILLINSYTPCTYHNVRTSAWNIVAINSGAININGVFGPLFQQVYLTLTNVSNLVIIPGAFRHVNFIMAIELRDANSTIDSQPGAFVGCRGTIIVSQPDREVKFKNDSFTDSVVRIHYLRSGITKVEELGNKIKPNQLLPPPSSGFCDALVNDKEKSGLTNSETQILSYITLGCVILVLAFCIAINVSIIMNGRATGKYAPSSVKFTKKAKEPRIVNGNNLNASTAGMPSMSKSPLLPPRNPTTERNLPRPPVSIVNSSSR